MEIECAKYVLDANTFIQASRSYYSFDIARPFWNALVQFGAESKIVSIDKVFQELKMGDDQLKEWAKDEFANFFDTTRPLPIANHWKELIQWAASQSQYRQSAKDEFMEEHNADAWVIAYAMEYGCMVVTHEASRPEAKKRIPITNVCDAFGIDYCDTFYMLNDLKFYFQK